MDRNETNGPDNGATVPVALVTGGARRIGRAIAGDLAAGGFALAIHVNTSREEGEELAGQIRQNGGRAVVVQGDLTDAGTPARIAREAAQALGPIRLLVNSASLFEPDEIGDLTPERYEAHQAIHTRAPIFLAQEMAKALPGGLDGLIVNIIDQRVWKLTPQFFSYTLSKAALWSATQTMAQGLAPRIRVNAIGPRPHACKHSPAARGLRHGRLTPSPCAEDPHWRSLPARSASCGKHPRSPGR